MNKPVISDAMVEAACKAYVGNGGGSVVNAHVRVNMRDALEAVASQLAEDDYREIARLIGQIFFYGNFKAETHNERSLEELLRKTGHFHTTQAEADASLGAKK